MLYNYKFKVIYSIFYTYVIPNNAFLKHLFRLLHLKSVSNQFPKAIILVIVCLKSLGTTLHLICFHSLFSLPPIIAINYYQVFFLFSFLYTLSETSLFSFYMQEHEKRCWSVDFNLMDPKLLASGSDDAKGTT